MGKGAVGGGASLAGLPDGGLADGGRKRFACTASRRTRTERRRTTSAVDSRLRQCSRNTSLKLYENSNHLHTQSQGEMRNSVGARRQIDVQEVLYTRQLTLRVVGVRGKPQP
jgi:hypothetical protein